MAASPSVLASVRAGLRALRRSPRALLMLLAAQVVVTLCLILNRWVQLNVKAVPGAFFPLLPILFDAAAELVTVSALCFARETLVLEKPARLSAFILPCTRGAWRGVLRTLLLLACVTLLKNGLVCLCSASFLVGALFPASFRLPAFVLCLGATGLLMFVLTLHARAGFAFSPDIGSFFAMLRGIKRWLPALFRFSLLWLFVIMLLPQPAQPQADDPHLFFSYFIYFLPNNLIQLLSYATLPFLYGGQGPLAKD